MIHSDHRIWTVETKLMEHDYTALGMSLDAGSWADWFAGSMSFAAVAAALFGYWVVHWQRLSDAKELEKRTAETVGWKALQVFNDTATVAKHLKQSLEDDGNVSFLKHRFARVRPLGIPNRPTEYLTQAEISFLIKVKGADILMNLQDALARYDSIRFAMSEYRIRHEALFERMPTPTATNATIMTHHLTKEQHDKVEPYAIMLDALLDSVIELVGDGVEKSAHLLTQYQDVMKVYFGKWHIVFDGSTDASDLTLFRSMPIDKGRP
jgi:hypothetical protein